MLFLYGFIAGFVFALLTIAAVIAYNYKGPG